MFSTRNEDEGTTARRLNLAAQRQHPVTITYVAGDGETVRTIEPYELKLSQDGTSVRVMAMCRLRGELRAFRLDRIKHYTIHRSSSFKLEPPAPANPDEITDWWTITSRTGHEILQLELNTDGKSNPYALVLGDAMARSGRVRAVCRAERGVTIRRLRRRDVLALN